MIPDKGQVLVKISDNVLESKEWGQDALVLRYGVVTRQMTLTKGTYSIPNMVGWTREQLTEWLEYDGTGNHPEEYHEIEICL